MSNDNQSADAMALLVGLMDPPEVEEGNVARTSDRTSDLLSSEGLPLACFVQVDKGQGLESKDNPHH